jgi:hypothetical protein
MAVSNIELKVILDRMEKRQETQECKLDALADSVLIHHTQAVEKEKRWEQLYKDIHGNNGNGNGNGGLKSEITKLKASVDKLNEWMSGQKRAGWIVITAALTAVTAAAVSAIIAFGAKY